MRTDIRAAVGMTIHLRELMRSLMVVSSTLSSSSSSSSVTCDFSALLMPSAVVVMLVVCLPFYEGLDVRGISSYLCQGFRIFGCSEVPTTFGVPKCQLAA